MDGGKRIAVPDNLSVALLRQEFGVYAVSYYESRLDERKADGRIYYNPLKTIYLWAMQDRATNQGYWSSYCGYARRHKNKNYGRT